MTIAVRGSARIDSVGKVTQLGVRPVPDEVVTVEDVQQPDKLAKLLVRLLASVANLKRTFVPRRIDFEDVAVGAAGASIQLAHNLGGRVRWYVAGWQCAANATPILREDTTNTTSSTLVLLSYQAGTAVVRVEEVG